MDGVGLVKSEDLWSNHFNSMTYSLDSLCEILNWRLDNSKPTKRRKSRTMCQVHEVGSPVGLLLVIQQIESGSLVLRCSNHTCQIPLTCEELQPFVVLATDLVWDFHQLLCHNTAQFWFFHIELRFPPACTMSNDQMISNTTRTNSWSIWHKTRDG